MLYAIYTAPLAEVIKLHSMTLHFYADVHRSLGLFALRLQGEQKYS